jgi:pimeloyl-ACP methyl ester carboxylesterase
MTDALPEIVPGIRYRAAGEGDDTVLWLHGYTMDSSVWGRLWERLPGFCHIGIDLPGHGSSAPLTPGDTLRSVAARIVAAADALKARHLAGISFGAMLALEVASLRGFETLVLGSPMFAGAPEDPHAQRRNLELYRLLVQRGRGPWMTELWMSSPPDIFLGCAKHPVLWEQLRTLIDRHSWSEITDGSMDRLVKRPEGATCLERIQASTLILVGEADMPAFRRTAELIRRGIRGSTRRYVPEAGHLCLLERPADVAPWISEHLHSRSG